MTDRFFAIQTLSLTANLLIDYQALFEQQVFLQQMAPIYLCRNDSLKQVTSTLASKQTRNSIFPTLPPHQYLNNGVFLSRTGFLLEAGSRVPAPVYFEQSTQLLRV